MLLIQGNRCRPLIVSASQKRRGIGTAALRTIRKARKQGHSLLQA
jgi:hypothetical protein